VLARLLALAEVAVRKRDRKAAVEALDRVLALDDGNARALALLRELDQRKRMRILARVAAAAGAGLSLLGLWFAFAPASGANTRSPTVKTAAVERAEERAEPAPVAGSPASTVPAGGKQGDQAPAASEPPARSPHRPRATGPRTVVFAPEPANVTVSVDGAPPQAFGPAFNEVELTPGPHTFRFVGAEQCCEDTVIELDVPPGPGETVVQAKLAFRDARLYVSSNVPANVNLDEAPVGRALSLISVPMERNRVMRRKISVTAPGHQPYTGHVQLRAGEVAQLEVALVPSAPL
jgi:hypothetical protein